MISKSGQVEPWKPGQHGVTYCSGCQQLIIDRTFPNRSGSYSVVHRCQNGEPLTLDATPLEAVPRDVWSIKVQRSDTPGVRHNIVVGAFGRRVTTELFFTPWECLELLRLLRKNEAVLLRLESMEDSTE